jgi:hypothetical protein
MRNNATIGKKSILCLGLALCLPSLALYSCSNNATTASNASIMEEINQGGCNVVTTLDGGSAITETASGSYTLYTNVPNGSHSVSIYSPYGSGVCSYNIQGASHEITIINACGAGFQISCN